MSTGPSRSWEALRVKRSAWRAGSAMVVLLAVFAALLAGATPDPARRRWPVVALGLPLAAAVVYLCAGALNGRFAAAFAALPEARAKRQPDADGRRA